MAFFGLTYGGYQEPFQQRKLELAKHKVPVGTPEPKLGLFYPKLPPIGTAGYDTREYGGSHFSYREAVRQRQLKTNPNQIYRVPLTCGQDIGWWMPSDPSIKPEAVTPWMKIPRHPLLQSSITKSINNLHLGPGELPEELLIATITENNSYGENDCFGKFVENMMLSDPLFSLF